MRVMFACYPATAHIYPMVTTAWALQNAGHQVCVASYRGLADTISAAGLTPVPLGEPDSIEARFAEDAPIPSGGDEIDRYATALAVQPHERDAWDIFYQYMLLPCSDYLRLDRPEAAELVAFVQDWQPDLVIWDPAFPIAAVAAKASGAAHARFVPGVDTYAWGMARLAERREQVLAAGLDANPMATMVAPVAEHFDVDMGDDLLFGHFTIDPMPAGMRVPTGTRNVPVRWVSYAGAQAVPAALRGKPTRPRIAVSMGVSTRQAMSGSHVRDEGVSEFPAEMNPELNRLAMLMEAVDGLDIDVVATLSKAQLDGLPPLPSNVHPVHYLPLPQLLPTCTALVHHGGIGTLMAAIAARVPHLVFDTGEPARIEITELENGELEYKLPDKKVEATWSSTFVIDSGAGERLDHKTQTVAEIRKLIQQVVETPRYQEGADSLYHEWMTTPGPNDIVTTLEVLAAHYSSR